MHGSVLRPSMLQPLERLAEQKCCLRKPRKETHLEAEAGRDLRSIRWIRSLSSISVDSLKRTRWEAY